MKKIIVTGANGNLGKAITRKFIENGNRVIVVVENETMINELEKSANLQVEVANLLDENKAALLIEKCVAKEGKIDAAILLVGGFAMGNINGTSLQDVNHQIGLNFSTAYNVVRPVFKVMMENQKGRIVLIGARPALDSSVGKDTLAYALSKSMLFKLAELLNEEAKGKDVTVTVIVPSTIDTPQNRVAMPDADFSKWVRPESIAEVVEFIVSESSTVLREGILKVYNNA
jgi:NAD(P)-dependent dehydrogenase (short-subunit alcohol dehydrogenase family)